MDNGSKIRVMWHPDDYFKLQWVVVAFVVVAVVVLVVVVVVDNERSSEFRRLLSSRKGSGLKSFASKSSSQECHATISTN